MHAAEMHASEVPPRPWQIMHWQARRGQVEPDDAHRAPPLCLHYVVGEPLRCRAGRDAKAEYRYGTRSTRRIGRKHAIGPTLLDAPIGLRVCVGCAGAAVQRPDLCEQGTRHSSISRRRQALALVSVELWTVCTQLISSSRRPSAASAASTKHEGADLVAPSIFVSKTLTRYRRDPRAE